MTVAELIKWLKTQDQGAEVHVCVAELGPGYEGVVDRMEAFDPEKHAEYTDFRGNQFAVGQPWQNDRLLYLGQRS